MKFSEAMQALKDGKKVSLPGWDSLYIRFVDHVDGCRLVSFNLLADRFEWNLSTLMEDDWLVNGISEHCTFEGVINALRYGKSAKKADWDDKLIRLDQQSGEIIQISYAPFPFNPSFKDLLREDWFVVGETK